MKLLFKPLMYSNVSNAKRAIHTLHSHLAPDASDWYF